jgi:putative redox protein
MKGPVMTTITVRSHGKFRQEIVADDHTFYADEPASLGGKDTGPNPYALLLGALGSCTSITVQMYARRKGWPLEGIEVELTHRKDYQKDCETCDEKEARIDVIDLHLRFFGPLDDDQRARLHEMAQRCPVNQTLTKGIKVNHYQAQV